MSTFKELLMDYNYCVGEQASTPLTQGERAYLQSLEQKLIERDKRLVEALTAVATNDCIDYPDLHCIAVLKELGEWK